LDKPRLFIWSIAPNLDVFTTGSLRVWPTDRLTPLSCAMTMIGAAVTIGLCNIHEHYRSTELAVEAIVLALSAILLLGIILHERKLRHIELASRLEAIIKISDDGAARCFAQSLLRSQRLVSVELVRPSAYMARRGGGRGAGGAPCEG
jgi:hypothetical protein